jgi:SRSO17 transposase
VHLSYASPFGHTLVDVALYLPKSWTENPARRAEAGVPDTIGFATKPQLARRLIEAAAAGGLPCRWVAGDEAYGGDPHLALALRGLRLGYVLAVARSHRVPTGLGIFRADQIAPGLPKRAWQRLSAGVGAKRAVGGASRNRSKPRRPVSGWTNTSTATGKPGTAGPPLNGSPAGVLGCG